MPDLRRQARSESLARRAVQRRNDSRRPGGHGPDDRRVRAEETRGRESGLVDGGQRRPTCSGQLKSRGVVAVAQHLVERPAVEPAEQRKRRVGRRARVDDARRRNTAGNPGQHGRLTGTGFRIGDVQPEHRGMGALDLEPVVGVAQTGRQRPGRSDSRLGKRRGAAPRLPPAAWRRTRALSPSRVPCRRFLRTDDTGEAPMRTARRSATASAPRLRPRSHDSAGRRPAARRGSPNAAGRSAGPTIGSNRSRIERRPGDGGSPRHHDSNASGESGQTLAKLARWERRARSTSPDQSATITCVSLYQRGTPVRQRDRDPGIGVWR